MPGSVNSVLPPSGPSPLVLIIGVESLQHHDRPVAWPTALHTSRWALGAGTTQRWAARLWRIRIDLALGEWGASLSNLNAASDY